MVCLIFASDINAEAMGPSLGGSVHCKNNINNNKNFLMRKALLLALAATLTSNAQLEVKPNGQILAGNPSKSETSSTPVRYDTVAASEGVARKDSKANSEAAEGVDHGISYGFIAQEVQKIYPDLVRADENGMLAIDYNGFIPLLVDAVKNLSAKVAEQEETIAMLADPAGPSRKAASVGGVEAEKIALMQNRPNPFNVATTIECTLPESVGNAFLCVYDLQGKQVSHIDLTERGRVSTVIDGSTLQPGMYIYALIADGTEIDSKRMILTD